MVVSGGKRGQGAEQAQVHTEPMDGAGNGTMAYVYLPSKDMPFGVFSFMVPLVLLVILVSEGAVIFSVLARDLPRATKSAAVKPLLWQLGIQLLFGLASITSWLFLRSGELTGPTTSGDFLFVGYLATAQLTLAACTRLGAWQSVATANKARDASIAHYSSDDGCSVSSDVSTESTSSSGSSSTSSSNWDASFLDSPRRKRHRKRRSMARTQRRRSRRPSFLPPPPYQKGWSSDESFSSRSKFLRRRDTRAPSAPSHLMQCPHSQPQCPRGPPLPYGWGGVYSGTQGNSYGAMPPLYGPPCPRTADEPEKNAQ